MEKNHTEFRVKSTLKVRGKYRRRFPIFKVLGAIILVIAAIFLYFGLHNGKIMNDTLDEGLEILRENFTVTEVSDNDYDEIRLYGIMTFHIRQYDVEGLGNLCIMTTNMGLMQMGTFVVTPYEKQVPMLSTDFIYMPGSRKGYVEYFNLVSDPDAGEYQSILADLQAALDTFGDLDEKERDPTWYDSLLTVRAYKTGSASQDDRFRLLFADSITAYAEAAAAAETLSADEEEAQIAVVQDYCADMMEYGGISTNMFRKALGDETTADFFSRVFYGPARYPLF